jgi:aminoglycoside phosphotransferase
VRTPWGGRVRLLKALFVMADETFDKLVALATRHGLPSPASPPAPWTGATSTVFPWLDVVIKVPHDRADAIDALVTDAHMRGFLRGHEVAVPALRVIDETRTIFDVPVAIHERVPASRPIPGEVGDATWRDAWFATGRQLARIHAIPHGTNLPVRLRTFRQSPEVDPRIWLDALAARGVVTPADRCWLRDLLDRLADVVSEHDMWTLCHGDVNAGNILVDERTGAFRALIDLAGMGWLDPVWDFVAVPMVAVPWMLAGHRSVGPLPFDASAERRIVWCRVQTRLHAALSDPDDDTARRRLLGDFAGFRAWARALGLESGS